MSRLAFIVVLAAVTAAPALAQEPIFMDAATHPGQGRLYLRTQLFYTDYEDGQDWEDRLRMRLKLAYGIRGDLAFLLGVDSERLRFSEGITESGIAKATLRLKYRFFKRDLGPLDTWRASVFFGADIPTGHGVLSPEHVHPRIGLATTAILGRHGLNGQLAWIGRPGGMPDDFEVNASYLYRIAPARYSADTQGAWYLVAESLNCLRDDGRSRSDLALGLLYEARTWAAEAALRVPLAQNWPEERRYQAALGFRLLF